MTLNCGTVTQWISMPNKKLPFCIDNHYVYTILVEPLMELAIIAVLCEKLIKNVTQL